MAEPSETGGALVIVGPTAVGKTAVALQVAAEWPQPSHVVSVDSVQVYRGLDLGSAKPNSVELAQVPHYLINVADPNEDYTAGRYCEDVRSLPPLGEGHLRMFVGGTGFYLRALETGLLDLQAVPLSGAQLEAWERLSHLELHEELRRVDPDAAARIHPNDRYRVRRALEIVTREGASVSSLRERRAQPVLPSQGLLKVGLRMDRAELLRRVRQRAERMIASGWVEEVEGLVQKGFGDCRSLQAVGYRQVLEMVTGRLARENLLETVVMATSQLVKKQMTWFKKDSAITWLDASQGVEFCSGWILKELAKRRGGP